MREAEFNQTKHPLRPSALPRSLPPHPFQVFNRPHPRNRSREHPLVCSPACSIIVPRYANCGKEFDLVIVSRPMQSCSARGSAGSGSGALVSKSCFVSVC